jgi:hypothetical protein
MSYEVVVKKDDFLNKFKELDGKMKTSDVYAGMAKHFDVSEGEIRETCASLGITPKRFLGKKKLVLDETPSADLSNGSVVDASDRDLFIRWLRSDRRSALDGIAGTRLAFPSFWSATDDATISVDPAVTYDTYGAVSDTVTTGEVSEGVSEDSND